MAVQKEVNLNQPLDSSKESTLSKSPLTPELAQGALTLHGDRYNQLQVGLNRLLFWHPLLVAVLLFPIGLYFAYQAYEYVYIVESVSEFVELFFTKENLRDHLVFLMPLLLLTVMFLTVFSFYLSDELKTISEKFKTSVYMNELFGFDLRKFAKLDTSDVTTISPKERQQLKYGDNTQVIIYRDSPIAIATVVPITEKSSATDFYVEITGLHVRKVFAKVDFETLLIDWCLLRSRQLYSEFTNNKENVSGCKIHVLTNCYNFEKNYISKLKALKFELIAKSNELNPYERIESKKQGWITNFFYSIFGIERHVYGLSIFTANASEDRLLNKANEFSRKTIKKRK